MRSSSRINAEFNKCRRYALAIKSVGVYRLGAQHVSRLSYSLLRGFRLHSLPLRYILRMHAALFGSNYRNKGAQYYARECVFYAICRCFVGVVLRTIKKMLIFA